jgi:phosphoglycerate kinase
MVYKNFKTINDLKLKGKTVLLRIDINSQIKNNKPVLSNRIKEHSKTISLLKKQKTKIITIAYQSRPGKPDFTSLKKHATLINKQTKIKFIPDIIGKKSKKAIKSLKEGDAILLENIRYLKDEYNPGNNKITKFFKDKFDIYINDAFSICHRNQTSITQLPKLTEKAIGPVLEYEIRNIDKIKNNLSNSLFILGGNKIEDVLLLIKNNKSNKILPTGILALLVLKAKGYDLGKKQTKLLKDQLRLIPKIKKHLKNIKTPKDLAFNINGKRKDIPINDFPINNLAHDIGMQTIKDYEKEIKKTKKIFWKGTAGDCSKKHFDIGTNRLLKAMEKSKAFSIVSGGHSETQINKLGINKKKLGYVSLSGGALIHYLSNKKLPGLEALKIK